MNWQPARLTSSRQTRSGRGYVCVSDVPAKTLGRLTFSSPVSRDEPLPKTELLKLRNGNHSLESPLPKTELLKLATGIDAGTSTGTKVFPPIVL